MRPEEDGSVLDVLVHSVHCVPIQRCSFVGGSGMISFLVPGYDFFRIRQKVSDPPGSGFTTL
jgi:hypothetical protein